MPAGRERASFSRLAVTCLADAGSGENQCRRVGGWGLFLGDAEVKEFRDVFRTHRELYTTIATGLIERGVMPEPDVREPWFMQLSHSDDDIAYTLQAYEDTLRSIPEEDLHPEVEEEQGDM